jgi:hypothetical protein
MRDLMQFLATRALLLAVIAGGTSALAQSQLPGGGGQSQLPSNPALRSFGPNAGFGMGGTPIVRPYSPMSGNAFATGNIRGGLSLRSFSPISDPTAFRASLGSGSLSSFIRDSVSVYDSYSSGSAPFSPYTPFYDPARTAPTAGFLSGQQYPSATLQGGLNKPNDFSVSRPTPGLLNYGVPGAQRFDPMASRTGAPPVATSIFGVMPVKPVDLNQPIKPMTTDPITPLRELPNSARFPTPLSHENPAERGQMDTRVIPRPIVEPLGAPLDVVLKGNVQDLLAPPKTMPSLLDERPPLPDKPRDPAQPPLSPRVTALRDASMLPGNDVFTDMRLALAMISDPKATEVFRDMQKAAAGMARPTGQAAAQEIEAAVFIDRLMKAPIKTFVGEGTSPVNDEMLKGESLLQIGQFYDAARRFERAAMLDPGNPLPNIGRGHALLAAGDYLSASLSLVRGLERYPEITRFDVDLKSFFKTAEIIDIRRADLMQQLERHEDPTLRFLLGYLEYYTGDRERGMANLEKAAGEADPGSIIRRYPALLRNESLPPPPKLPTLEEPAPGAPGGKDGE